MTSFISQTYYLPIKKLSENKNIFLLTLKQSTINVDKLLNTISKNNQHC